MRGKSLERFVLHFTYVVSLLISPALSVLKIGRPVGDIISLLSFLIYLVYGGIVFKNNLWKLFLIGVGVGFILEYIGLNTGLPFGSYEYLAFKAIRILGVPYPIILAWGMYIVVSYNASKYILEKGDFRSRVVQSMLPSILMVYIDIAVDPIMVNKRIWIWRNGFFITWFGVPLSNFIGWFIVSLVIMWLYYSISPTDVREDIHILYPISYLFVFLPLVILVANECLLLIPIATALTLYISTIVVLVTID